MKVVVVTSDVPFIYGGHIVIAEELTKQLNKNGYEAILWKTPQNKFGHQLSAYLANYLSDLTETGYGEKIDAVISLRFPAYAVRHPKHICWLNHRMREYYDLWYKFRANLSFLNLIKENVRKFIIHRIDAYLLKHNVKKVFAQSKNIQNRLQRWGKIRSEVLYPPAVERHYRFDTYGEYILIPSRLYEIKRVDMAIKALPYVNNKALFLVIVGEGPEIQKLIQLAKNLKVKERVKFMNRLSNEELVDMYAKCLAVFYAPLDEDYGLVTLEAFSSRKAVITCSDSGGATELIIHNENGMIVNADEKMIAETFDLISDKSTADRLGQNAYALSKKYTWEETIQKLLS